MKISHKNKYLRQRIVQILAAYLMAVVSISEVVKLLGPALLNTNALPEETTLHSQPTVAPETFINDETATTEESSKFS